MADAHGDAVPRRDGLFQRPQRRHVEVVRGLVEHQDVTPRRERLGELQSIALAAGELPDLLLLIGTLEVVPAAVRPRVDGSRTERNLLRAAGELLEDRLVVVQRIAALVHVHQLDRLAHDHLALVGLVDSGDHLEQRRLAGAVGADDADDGAGRYRAIESIDEQAAALVPLGHALHVHDDVAEAWGGGDRDAVEVRSRGELVGLVAEFLVRAKASLALLLLALGVLSHPLQLLVDRSRQRVLLLLLGFQPLGLGLQPGAVVALERDALAAVELEDPPRDVVQEVAVVRDRDDGARERGEELLEPRHALRVQVVRGLVQEQDVGLREEQTADGHAAALASGEVLHERVARGASKGVHRALHGPVDLPRVGGVELGLQRVHAGHQLVHVAVRVGHVHRDLVVLVDVLLHRRDAHLDVLHHRLAVVQGGFLGQVPDLDAVVEIDLAVELLVHAREDLHQGGLTRAVGAQDANLGAEVHPEVDVLDELLPGRGDLADLGEGEDDLAGLGLVGGTLLDLSRGFVALVAAGLRATAGGLRATATATGLALVLLSRDDAEGSAAVGLLTGRGAC